VKEYKYTSVSVCLVMHTDKGIEYTPVSVCLVMHTDKGIALPKVLMSRIDPEDFESEWRLFYKSAQYNGSLGDGPASRSHVSLATRRSNISWSPSSHSDMRGEQSLSPSSAGASVASHEEPRVNDSDIEYAPR
jgi:hypothetical protein